VERKLGKGGFGQVYVGRRVVPVKDTEFKDGPNANCVRALRSPFCFGFLEVYFIVLCIIASLETVLVLFRVQYST
jgi:hypothetical protein